jgi:glycine cleavage system H lipoate-binding protein
MKGRIQFRSCTHDYQCHNCDFDQYFHDQYAVYAVVNPVDLLNVKGIKVPQGYYFHKGHMWAKIEEGSGIRVGADDFALRLLGPPDRIEAPLMGKEVIQGSPSIQFIRGENKATLLSPISGVVTSINPELRENGHPAHEDPYSDGWIMKIEPGRLRQDLAHLMINEETDQFIEDEVDRLYQVIEETSGPLSTDGGNLIRDIYGNMPELGWERLTKEFLLNK